MSAAAAVAAAFFPAQSSSGASSSGKAAKGGTSEGSDSFNACGVSMKPNLASCKAMQVKAQAQAAPKINGTKVGGKVDGQKGEDEVVASAPKTFYNQLPDWSMLLAAITTVFLAAEKQWTLLDWKPKRPDMLTDAFGFGRIMPDGLVFRQHFSIRSYEIGADSTASVETLMNHLQETALNHVRSAGLLGDGFGSTPEMAKRNLIWVVSKMQVMVEHYPSWGDIVQVDTWAGASGKNGMRRDWHVCDHNSGRTILRATSVWVLMNKLTRKLAKMPDEVRGEIRPYLAEYYAISADDSSKLPKVGSNLGDNPSQYIRKGLTPRWSDLDVNQHVNNVKYVSWILEGAPISILEHHELSSMTIDYRKECGRNNVLQSVTNVSSYTDDVTAETTIHCQHLLQLETGGDILKAQTEWRPKGSQMEDKDGTFSALNA